MSAIPVATVTAHIATCELDAVVHAAVDGNGVGARVGTGVGCDVGVTVGACVGNGLGAEVGSGEGKPVGTSVGAVFGSAVGSAVGESVGVELGSGVGLADGIPTQQPQVLPLGVGVPLRHISVWNSCPPVALHDANDE